jgi:hypothetical protein
MLYIFFRIINKNRKAISNKYSQNIFSLAIKASVGLKEDSLFKAKPKCFFEAIFTKAECLIKKEPSAILFGDDIFISKNLN